MSLDSNMRDTLASEILNVYIRRSREKGGNLTVTQQIYDIALKAADKCAEANVSPEMYVAAIEKCTPSEAKIASKHLFPIRMLNATRAVEFCKQYEKLHGVDFESLFEVQISYLCNYVARNSATVETALMDRHMDFTPWFRTLITKAPVEEILEVYGPAAVLELNDTKLRKFLEKKGLDLSRLCQYSQ